jgi:hypothetical protein
MSGKKPGLTLLESHKQLLVAESELNRHQMVQEWCSLREGAQGMAGRAKSIGSVVSVTGMLMAGLGGLWRSKNLVAGGKTFWLPMIFKGAQVAASAWLAFRARRR